ncbi:hypothetical protein Pcinc_023685 [Petrolisthes cinctipes]|uniref:histone acetyltransferase n=1 Tax=Petrolisthes cinctipes TaxID=88211 RepID=A0AAE1FD12_PETCI|nr:hypothetical protein Pcinc_023685 [Petrolisthes cinctipes]
MDGRDTFLTLARKRHLEFSSLRRAKYSTMVMMYELHNQGQDRFVYTCNHCKAHVETRYHCQECDYLNLCTSCFKAEGHNHKMVKLGLDLEDDTETKYLNLQEARITSIERCIQFLVHASQCRDANCRLASCEKMKKVFTHVKICKRKNNIECVNCKQFIALCLYHARNCQVQKCDVLYCCSIKQKLRQQQTQLKSKMKRIIAAHMVASQPIRPLLPPAFPWDSPLSSLFLFLFHPLQPASLILREHVAVLTKAVLVHVPLLNHLWSPVLCRTLPQAPVVIEEANFSLDPPQLHEANISSDLSDESKRNEGRTPKTLTVPVSVLQLPANLETHHIMHSHRGEGYKDKLNKVFCALEGRIVT